MRENQPAASFSHLLTSNSTAWLTTLLPKSRGLAISYSITWAPTLPFHDTLFRFCASTRAPMSIGSQGGIRPTRYGTRAISRRTRTTIRVFRISQMKLFRSKQLKLWRRISFCVDRKNFSMMHRTRNTLYRYRRNGTTGRLQCFTLKKETVLWKGWKNDRNTFRSWWKHFGQTKRNENKVWNTCINETARISKV